jgi:hypothetical protein
MCGGVLLVSFDIAHSLRTISSGHVVSLSGHLHVDHNAEGHQARLPVSEKDHRGIRYATTTALLLAKAIQIHVSSRASLARAARPKVEGLHSIVAKGVYIPAIPEGKTPEHRYPLLIGRSTQLP